jgi:hypothetical protein
VRERRSLHGLRDGRIVFHRQSGGGLAGADQLCNDAAAGAGLPGTYFAWLSTTAVSPPDRFMQSTGPYKRVDGTTIAANWADLIDGTIDATISLDENGNAVDGNDDVWTGTAGNGAGYDDSTCGDWTSSSGFAITGGTGYNTSGLWTDAGRYTCEISGHLYCFQQSA